jgi:hypothetical protein
MAMANIKNSLGIKPAWKKKVLGKKIVLLPLRLAAVAGLAATFETVKNWLFGACSF